jgi:hypothetical protein
MLADKIPISATIVVHLSTVGTFHVVGALLWEVSDAPSCLVLMLSFCHNMNGCDTQVFLQHITIHGIIPSKYELDHCPHTHIPDTHSFLVLRLYTIDTNTTGEGSEFMETIMH